VRSSSMFVSLARLIVIAKNPLLLTKTPGSDPTCKSYPLPNPLLELTPAGDNLSSLYVSILEAPFGIVALCLPPIHQIIRRFRNFGWRSLLSPRQYTTPSYDSDKMPGPRHLDDSGNSGPERVTQSKVSSGDMATKNYYKFEGRAMSDERGEASSRKPTSRDGREEAQLEDLEG